MFLRLCIYAWWKIKIIILLKVCHQFLITEPNPSFWEVCYPCFHTESLLSGKCAHKDAIWMSFLEGSPTVLDYRAENLPSDRGATSFCILGHFNQASVHNKIQYGCYFLKVRQRFPITEPKTFPLRGVPPISAYWATSLRQVHILKTLHNCQPLLVRTVVNTELKPIFQGDVTSYNTGLYHHV